MKAEKHYKTHSFFLFLLILLILTHANIVIAGKNSVTVTIDPSGAVTSSPSGGTEDNSGNFTFTAEPAVGYTYGSHSLDYTSAVCPSDKASISKSGNNYTVSFSQKNQDYVCEAIVVFTSSTTTTTISTTTTTSGTTTTTTLAGCMQIDDKPVEVQIKGAPANIMFIIDDADSMDNEISTLESDTEFAGFEYLYGISGDYTSTSPYSDNTKALNKAEYLGEGGGNERGSWKALWSNYNKVYYNPTITYTPWPTATSGPMSDAPIDSPYSHPIDKGFQISLDNPYFTVPNYTLSDGNAGTDLQIPVSHYYIQDSSNVYLIIIRKDTSSGTYSHEYYQIVGAHTSTTPHETILDSGITVTELDSSSVPSAIKGWSSAEDERQNFANWFQYYRRRQLMAVNAIAKTIFNLSGVNMGFTATEPATDSSFSNISTNPADYLNLGLKDSSGHGLFIQPVLPVKTHKTELINRLYDYRAGTTSSSNFVRRALEEVVKYFDNASDTDTNFGPSPITETCQQNFVVVFCDGAYSGGAPNDGTKWDDLASAPDSSVHITTTDKDGNTVILTGVQPYSDGSNTSKTMADMAMRGYLTDLATNLADEVPTNDVDLANWQHLVTYTITYGDKGLHDPDAVPTTTGGTAPFDLDDPTTWPAAAYSNSCTPWCWPGNVTSATDLEKIDDIWHSAINGRGEFFAADNPQKLEEALAKLIASIQERIGASGAAVSVSSNELVQGTNVFQSKYNTSGWAGDVYAYQMQSDGSWSQGWGGQGAGALLDAKDKSTRNIGTYSGTTGIEFTGDLTSYDSSLTSDMVSYLRGDKTNEAENGGSYRNRLTSGDTSFTLGDIVHSSPVYHDDVLYVGANDGMLHAFRAEESSSGAGDAGQELFAYVPSFVHSTIAELADTGYSHKYYVDLSPTIETVSLTSGGTTTETDILVGGLGKGGKGYFGLDVTNPASNTGTGASTWVKWEYPTSTDNDMGYSYSKPWIVQSYDTSHPWVVIFGNGYDSTNEEAILYVLDAFTGAVVRKIETGVTGCNGLSTPIAVDVNDDRVMDYVYAGDLNGNLWKFDMTDSSASNWDSAYESSGNPAPLFKQSKPITTMPDVMKHCDEHGYMVFFGTGKLLSYDSDVNSDGHRVYGIWDFGDDEDDSEYLGELQADGTVSNMAGMHTELFEHAVTNYVYDGITYRLIGTPGSDPNWTVVDDDDTSSDATSFNMLAGSTYLPNPTGTSSEPSNVGWFFELPEDNERITIDVKVRAGVLYVVTTAPGTQEICSSYSGKSWLLAINACTGGILNKPVWDSDGDGEVDESDMIEIPDGNGGTMKIYPPEPPRDEPDPPTIVGITFTEENIIVSYEDGNFGTPDVDPVSPSLLFWRQVE